MRPGGKARAPQSSREDQESVSGHDFTGVKNTRRCHSEGRPCPRNLLFPCLVVLTHTRRGETTPDRCHPGNLGRACYDVAGESPAEPLASFASCAGVHHARMPRIRRKLPRIFASLLVALSIACLPAPLVRVARAAGQESPAPAQKSALDAPARELARRIAASLPGGTRVEIEVRNQSSLSEDDAASIRAALAGELSARGLRTSGEGPSAASVVVTLSENVQGYVWVAQIQHGDDSAVLLQSAPREATPAVPAPESQKIVLRKELLWSGPAHVLDAVEPSPSDANPTRLFLLVLEGEEALVTDAAGSFRALVPAPPLSGRDARGRIFPLPGESIGVTVGDSLCTIRLQSPAQSTCQRPVAVLPAQPLPGLGSGRLDAHLACGEDTSLATGPGDDTQPDFLRAFQMRGPELVALSAQLSFSGPVVSLVHDYGTGTAMAIVRNLENGNYEVYRITAACGQ